MAVELNCPTCQTVLATYGDTIRCHNDGVLTFDHGAIPATPSEIDGKSAVAFAPVGRCKVCRAPYWFVEYIVYPGSKQDLYEHLAGGELPKRCRSVRTPEFDQPWIYQDVAIEAGLVQFHQIGPFEVPPGTSPLSPDAGFWAIAAGQACAAWPTVTVFARSSNAHALAAGVA